MSNTKNTSNWFDLWNDWTSCSVQSFHCFQSLQCIRCVSSSEATWIVFSLVQFYQSLSAKVCKIGCVIWVTHKDRIWYSIHWSTTFFLFGRAFLVNFQLIAGINTGPCHSINPMWRVNLGIYFNSCRCRDRCGVEQWQLVGLITRRSQVQILPPLLKQTLSSVCFLLNCAKSGFEFITLGS